MLKNPQYKSTHCVRLATGAWKGGIPMVDHIWVVELESGKTYYRKTKREAESCGTPDDPVNKVYREDYCT